MVIQIAANEIKAKVAPLNSAVSEGGKGASVQAMPNAESKAVEQIGEGAIDKVVPETVKQVEVQATSQAGTPLTEQSAEHVDKVANTQDVGSTALQMAEQVGTNVAEQASAAMPMESAFTWGSYFQAIGTLLLLLAMLWGVVWIVRKYGRFNFLPKPGSFPRDGLRLESQLPLGPRKGLMVVRFLNKRLLLGVTDHQITLLKETEDDDNKNNLEFKEVMEMVQSQKSDD